jgi:hypothetical protein
MTATGRGVSIVVMDLSARRRKPLLANHFMATVSLIGADPMPVALTETSWKGPRTS